MCKYCDVYAHVGCCLTTCYSLAISQIDSRRFGNVGSFIRRRPAHPASGSSNNVFTVDEATGISISSISSSNSKKYDKMLDKRLVYVNFRPDGSGPKLALFAARSIDAGSELFI